MAAPHEVVAAPLTLYVAPVGTAFPDIDDLPSTFDAAWILIGAEGDRNYGENGVTVSHAETVADFTPAGSTMPTKRFRTAEDFLIKLDLVDLSPTGYALAMNDAVITTVNPITGVPGKKSFSLFRGDQVASFAVYCRGMSTIDNDLNLEYLFSKAFMSVNGDVIWNKGVPARLPLEVQAIRHTDSDLIECGIQTHAAS